MALFNTVAARGGTRNDDGSTINNGRVSLYTMKNPMKYYTKPVVEIKVEDEDGDLTWIMLDEDNLTELIDALQVLRAGMEK